MIARHWLQSIAIVGLLLVVVLLSGCFFNAFQTARTIGEGNVALTLGSGVINVGVSGDYDWVFTPQGRITIGLTDNLDIGIQSGINVWSSGETSFLGVAGNLKIGLIQDPEFMSFSLGIGAGYLSSLLGWGVEGSVYLDSNIRFLPIFFVYRPMLFLDDDSLNIVHHLGGGLHLDLSDHVRLLVEIDSWNGELGGGMSLDIVF